MMEYVSVIKIGSKNSVRIAFTDGTITAMGTNPATFTTDNLMIQHAIMNSADYKRGLIKTVNEIELDAEVKIDKDETKVVEPASEVVAEEKPEEAKSEVKEMEFANNGDAKEYLETTYGVNPAKLRSREVIESTARNYGIEIRWAQ